MGGRPTDSVQRATTSSPAGAATVRATDEEPAVTNRHGRRTSAERGVAAVEFALLTPLLVLFLLGIIEFGQGYNTKITLTHSAREGVRALVVGNDPEAAAEGTAPQLDPAQLNVMSDTCDSTTAGDPVSVTVTYPYSYDIPFFGSASVTMTETATMRCGG